MSGFCGSCGFALGANSSFCPRCGGRQAAAGPVQPLSAPAKGASKLLIGILVFLGVAGAAVIGGVWYVGHRVKEVVIAKAHEQGVDLNTIVPPKTRSTAHHRHGSPCDLLSKEEASALLGETVVRAVVQDQACMYMGPPGLTAKLAESQMSGAFKKAQAPGASGNGMEVASAVDQMVNSLGAAGGQTGVDGEMPLLMLIVDFEDGRAQMTAINASAALFGGIFNAAQEGKGAPISAQIKGLGDQAVRVPKLGLNVLAGDSFLRLIPGPIPDADAKSIDVARAVLKKL